MSNMWKRILVGLIGIPIVGALLYVGGYPFLMFVVLLTVIGLWEATNMARENGVRLRLGISAVFSVLLVLQQAGVLAGAGASSLSYSHILVVFTVLLMTVELFKNQENPTSNILYSLGMTVFLSLGFSSLYQLRETTDIWGTTEAGFPLVLSVFAAIWACDSGAYFVGKTIGRNKVFPRVSPNKTWEGSIGGVVLGALAFWGISTWLFVEPPVVMALGLGALVSVVGQVGDFAESLIKRDTGVKDSSNIIPGHGGVLDRFDSALFAMPIAAVIVALMK